MFQDRPKQLKDKLMFIILLLVLQTIQPVRRHSMITNIVQVVLIQILWRRIKF